MAREEQSNTLAQFAPVGAPLMGVVLAIVFIVAIVMTSTVSDNKDKLQQTITKVSTRMGSTEVNPPDWGEIPSADSVSATLQTAPENSWKPKSAKPLLKLPIKWQVEIADAPLDKFDEYDKNGNGFWEREEFASRPPEVDSKRAKFENWDRNNDGLISREEANNPPASEDENFGKKDLDGNRFLTAPDEITEKEAYEWDRHDPKTGEYDGKINLDEFIRRWDPREERDLGPVTNVRVAVDPSTMQIVVSWDEPQLNAKPEDIAYYVERFAPETFEERMSAFRKASMRYFDDKTAWDRRFTAWLNDPEPQQGGKTRKELFPRGQDAEAAYVKATGDTKPDQPREPDPWEPVTDASSLETDTEYRDTSFVPGATYTYAVRMVTKKPVRGQPMTRNLLGLGGEWNGYPERQVHEGRPVMVRNRIEIRWKSQAGQAGTVTLSKWHRVGDEWFKVRVTQTLEANDAVGGEYTKSRLKDLDGRLIDANGTELGLDTLPADAKVDMSSGFTFVANTPKGFLLNSRELGDFELPRATAQEAIEKTDPIGKDNPIEVRALTVKNGGKEGLFEVTRWHKIGDAWLRIVWQGAVSQGKEVGGVVDLSSPGKGVTIFDASGNKVAKPHQGTVDLAAGTFDDLDGRTVVVGGERFDLFGTLYKE